MKHLTLQVLRALSHAEFRSGEALAHTFGVSRGTIHNALKGLDGLGVRIAGSPGLGYRLDDALSWLDAERIRASAGDAATMIDLQVEASCESTNTLLVDLARAGAASGTVIAAELQTSGRGRRGRGWESALGAALTFSLLWRFERGVAALSGLSLAVGVALVRALRGFGARAVMLKWPNDLVLPAGKLGGILIEVEGDALGPSAAIIGIGLNVRLSSALRRRIDQPAIDLVDAGVATADRNDILGALLRELCVALAAFEQGGFHPFRHEWQAYHAHQDRPVVLLRPDGVRESGVARGVNDDGALLIEQGETMRICLAGDVSLRA
ncbi:MAG: biotin--[acetyl-CoA-carboxylase] ligase [Burkholderiales bacterium]|nr:biotin--[acetyl-CoA-carboxylase] ligase [Burkholderiales bacterium]